MKPLAYLMLGIAVATLIAGCGSDRAASGGAQAVTEDRAVANARSLTATSNETREPADTGGTPVSDPETSDPVAI